MLPINRKMCLTQNLPIHIISFFIKKKKYIVIMSDKKKPTYYRQF